MKRIAIDIETSGLRPWGGKIYCLSYKEEGGKAKLVTNPETLRTVLEDPNTMKVIHNAGFDGTWLKVVHGITVRNIWDTRLIEQVILGCNVPRSEKDPDIRAALSSSLKYTLVRYGFPDLEKGMGADFAKRDINAPLTDAEKKYALLDVEYLLQLQKAQEYIVTKADLLAVAELENQVVEVVIDMRSRGIGFDSKIWLQLAEQANNQYIEILKRLPSGINWNSPAQIKTFFAKRGVIIDSLTNLETIAKTTSDPVLEKLIQLREVYKNATTYGASWLYDDKGRPTVDGDGRVRCEFEQILNTGRFSSSEPNLQQLPREGQHRAAFVPKKGHVFVVGDFSGQEIGIMAAAGQEDIWINAMLRGDDVHGLTASLLYPTLWEEGKELYCTFPKKCKCPGHQPPREKAKALNFMLAYGGGPEKFSLVTGLSLDDAKRTIKRYKRVVPKLTRWLDRQGNMTEKTFESYSADPYRRRRMVHEAEGWRRRTVGKNNPIQSSGANQLKLSMISMPKEYPIVLVIHDEIILEVPKKEAKKAAVALKTVMEKAAAYCTGIAGLIKVDPKIKTNLAK